MSIAAFFKPTNKRPREEEEGGAAASTSAASTSAAGPLPSPLKLCCWNANSLLNRIEKDGEKVSSFLNTESPDVLFISEVRMPAAAPPGSKKDDGKPRRREALARGTAAQVREADIITSFVRNHNYRAYWSLSDSKYSGCGLLVRRGREVPSSLRFSLSASEPTAHHPEGRVILASFSDFDLLGTYSPNNGTHEASFAKRRQWDAACEALLRERASSGEQTGTSESSSAGASHSQRPSKPLIWLGDLNVAAGWEDVGPSPDWFRHQNGQSALHEGDKGQPGFTANEQERFAGLCGTGDLVDAYRHLHPSPNWQTDVTWRGTPGVNNPAEGRYYNKGMRIDYVLLSRSLVPRLRRAVVHGTGSERVGFLGSDHCPLIVELTDVASSGSEADVASSGSEVLAAGKEAQHGLATTEGSADRASVE